MANRQLGAINTVPTGGVTPVENSIYQHCSYTFIATRSQEYLSLLFRNDPGFTWLDTVSVTTVGDATHTNLLVNGDFEGGGQTGHPTLPIGWTAIGTQALTFAGALGTAASSLDGAGVPQGGTHFWVDGATAGYDGLAQLVTLRVGATYTLSFELAVNPNLGPPDTNGPNGGIDTQVWLGVTVQDGPVTYYLVDPTYYDGRYADVAAAAADPQAHYDANGWREGRDPNAFFTTSGYEAWNKDVRDAGVNPLQQYDQSGWKEGRDPSAGFDTRLYLLHNQDVARAGIDPLYHYLHFGQAEGRVAYAAVGPAGDVAGGFDDEFYILSNPDIARYFLANPSFAPSGLAAVEHYYDTGWKEGRNPDAFFDTRYYLAQNPDVAAAGINPLIHYDENGWHEGRNPSAAFNTSAYLAHSPDVRAAGINPLEHYLQFGIYEGRPIT